MLGRRGFKAFTSIVLLLLVLLTILRHEILNDTSEDSPWMSKTAWTKIHPPFRLPVSQNTQAHEHPHSVLELPQWMEQNPNKLFSSIYSAEHSNARLKIPTAFAPKVRKMFARYPGGTEHLAFVEEQNIVTTYNRFTDELSLFNEIRRYRPGYMEQLPAADEAKLEELIRNTSGPEHCDFCRRDMSAEDIFGRIDGKHCYTASNVAKYTAWHGLVIGRQHHPLAIDAEIIGDYIETALRWFKKAHEFDSAAQFPHAMYDAGPRASASQIHSHLQLSLTRDRFYSKAEHTRQCAVDYEEENKGRNYWSDVLEVHDALGLAVRHGRSMVISHLCPVKEREVIVVAEDASDKSFGEAISQALKALKDDVGTRAFSMAILFQQLDDSKTADQQKERRFSAGELVDMGENFLAPAVGRSSRKFRQANARKSALLRESYPALARIVDRGNPMDQRSDVGAMEFFGANNVGADPYHIMPFLRKRLMK